jgi:hypothetical protein
VRLFLAAFPLFVFLAGTACAANLTIKLDNKSGEVLNSIAATAKGTNTISTQNILSAPVPSGASGTASVTNTPDSCVYTLIFTFASGKSTTRPDMDICHTSNLVVE